MLIDAVLWKEVSRRIRINLLTANSQQQQKKEQAYGAKRAPKASQLLAFSPLKEQAAGVWVQRNSDDDPFLLKKHSVEIIMER